MSAIFAPIRARRAVAMVWTAVAWCAVSAAQACDLVLETPESIRIDYNPFAIGPSSGRLDLGLRNGSDTPCDLRLRLVDDFDAPLAGSAPTRRSSRTSTAPAQATPETQGSSRATARRQAASTAPERPAVVWGRPVEQKRTDAAAMPAPKARPGWPWP